MSSNRPVIFMISSDRTLSGGVALGDAAERHANYGKYAERIDILVYSKKTEGLRGRTIASNVYGWASNSWNKLFFFFDALKVFKNVWAERRVDLIIAQDPFLFGLIGLWLKWKYGIKLEVNFHGDFWDNQSWLRERFINRLLICISYFVTKRADAVRVVSGVIKEKLVRRGIDVRKIGVIPTPVDESKFDNFDVDEVARIKAAYSGRKLILFVGRLHPVKNLPFLLSAFSLVKNDYKDVQLLIIGDGSEKKRLELEIVDNGLEDSVFLLGLLDQDKIVNYYHAADLLVLPSLSEGMPKVLVEGGFCGLPMIATNFPSASEVIKEGHNGFIVSMDDKEKFAERMLFLLRNNEERKKMGENSLSFMKENFTGVAERLGKFWSDIVSNSLVAKP